MNTKKKFYRIPLVLRNNIYLLKGDMYTDKLETIYICIWGFIFILHKKIFLSSLMSMFS
jgi:hypothetical protein